MSDRIGYEIVDSAGVSILSVRTVFEGEPGHHESRYITTLSGNFYDKQGRQALSATEADGGVIKSTTPLVLGFGGIKLGYSVQQLEFATIMQMSRGTIHQALHGVIEDQEIDLDGKALIDAQVRRCTLNLTRGDFVMVRSNIDERSLRLNGAAKTIYQFFVQDEEEAQGD